MKKVIRIAVIFLCIVFIGVVGFKTWSAKLVKEARELEDIFIDLSKVEDGTYEGHSELGPVIVDVKVTVKKGKIEEIEIIDDFLVQEMFLEKINYLIDEGILII